MVFISETKFWKFWRTESVSFTMEWGRRHNSDSFHFQQKGGLIPPPVQSRRLLSDPITLLIRTLGPEESGRIEGLMPNT